MSKKKLKYCRCFYTLHCESNNDRDNQRQQWQRQQLNKCSTKQQQWRDYEIEPLILYCANNTCSQLPGKHVIVVSAPCLCYTNINGRERIVTQFQTQHWVEYKNMKYTRSWRWMHDETSENRPKRIHLEMTCLEYFLMRKMRHPHKLLHDFDVHLTS